MDCKVRRLFEPLSRHDQHHLVSAHEHARSASDDPDIQLAALLHDVGKATLSGQQITLPARVFGVLAGLLPGRIRARIRPDRHGAWLTGPWLAEHHASLGAERLRALGVAEAVCRLVELHNGAGVTDAQLELLRKIDATII